MKEEKEEAHWYVIDGAHSGFSNTMISYAQMIWPHLQPPTENRGSGWPQWWRFLRESGLAENQSSPDNVRSIWEVNVANICHPHTSNLLLSTLLLLTQQVPSGRAGLNGWKKKINLEPKWRNKRVRIASTSIAVDLPGYQDGYQPYLCVRRSIPRLHTGSWARLLIGAKLRSEDTQSRG